jgi:hypothetical protein
MLETDTGARVLLAPLLRLLQAQQLQYMDIITIIVILRLILSISTLCHLQDTRTWLQVCQNTIFILTLSTRQVCLLWRILTILLMVLHTKHRMSTLVRCSITRKLMVATRTQNTQDSWTIAHIFIGQAQARTSLGSFQEQHLKRNDLGLSLEEPIPRQEPPPPTLLLPMTCATLDLWMIQRRNLPLTLTIILGAMRQSPVVWVLQVWVRLLTTSMRHLLPALAICTMRRTPTLPKLSILVL